MKDWQNSITFKNAKNFFVTIQECIQFLKVRHGRPQGWGIFPPPHETEKIGVEKLCYFPELHKMTKVLEDRIENWENFSIEDFIWKFQNFLKNSNS